MNINEKSDTMYYHKELPTDSDIDFNKKAVRDKKIISRIIDKHVRSLEKEEEDYIKKAIIKKVSKQWGTNTKDITDLDSDTKSVINKIKEIINKKQFFAITKIKKRNAIIVLKYNKQFRIPRRVKEEFIKKVYSKISIDFKYNKEKIDKEDILYYKDDIKEDFNCLLNNYLVECENSINRTYDAGGIHFSDNIFAEVVDEWYKSSFKSLEKYIQKKHKKNKIKIDLSFDEAGDAFSYSWIVLYMNKKSKKEMLENVLIHELGHFFSVSSANYKKNISYLERDFIKWFAKNYKNKKEFKVYDLISFLQKHLLEEKLELDRILSFNMLSDEGQKKIVIIARKVLRSLYNGGSIRKIKDKTYKFEIDISDKKQRYWSRFEERVEHTGDSLKLVYKLVSNDYLNKMRSEMGNDWDDNRCLEYFLTSISNSIDEMNFKNFRRLTGWGVRKFFFKFKFFNKEAKEKHLLYLTYKLNSLIFYNVDSYSTTSNNKQKAKWIKDSKRKVKNNISNLIKISKTRHDHGEHDH